MFDEPLREAIWWWITITTGYRNVSWDKLHMCGHVICFFVNLNFRWWDPYICRLKSHVVYFFGGLHHRFAGPQLLLSKSPFVAALLVDVSICCRVSLHFHQSDRSFFVLNPMFSTVNLLFLAQLCSENPPCLLVRFQFPIGFPHFPIVFWCFPYEIPMFPWFAEKPPPFWPHARLWDAQRSRCGLSSEKQCNESRSWWRPGTTYGGCEC